MKKSKIFMLMLSIGLLFSCETTGDQSKSSSVDNTRYKINYEDSKYYSISSYDSSKSGEVVTLSVQSKYDACTIANVYYNGNICTHTEGNDYSFTMPSLDVDITVDVTWTTVDTDSFLSWDNDNAIVIKDETLFHYTADLNYTTLAEVTYFTTDESIIPSTSITHNYSYVSKSNVINGGYITVSKDNLKNGTTQLVIIFDAQNGSPKKACISIPLIVTLE